MGASDITVTLSWDDMSCGFDTLTNLRMAAWKDTVWKDLGNGGTTGDSLVGTMQSNGASTVYGAFALATVDTFRCVPCRAYAGEDRIIYAGWIIRLGQDAAAELSYLWAPDYNIDNATASNPLVNPKYELEYKLQTTNASGCVAKDDVHIEVRTPVRLNHNCVVN